MAEPLISEVAETEQVYDEAESDEAVPHPRYDITSYGSDPDVEGLVRRLGRGEILIPPFQRSYVWRLPEASRFIESLLLGLPVPGVFFAVEPGTNKLLVIDGQQRLRTLQFFHGGVFNPRPGESRQRVFALTGVHPRFEGKQYSNLEEPDRLRLDNSIIHATIVRQDSPPGDDTSVYHIFERLNSGGQKLTPQEIRAALYHGQLFELLHTLNGYPNWRSIFGRPNARLKDQELILRYLAFVYELDRYERPMSEFLNKFAGRHQNPPAEFLAQSQAHFTRAIDLAWHSMEKQTFRPERALNAAVFDSTMVALTRLLEVQPEIDPKVVGERYLQLLAEPRYQEAVSRSTADETFVQLRMALATEFLSGAAGAQQGTP